MDRQVIDVGQIEASLRQYPGVREAAVDLAEIAPGKIEAIAWVVPDFHHRSSSTASSDELRKRVLKVGKLFDLAQQAKNAEPVEAGSNFRGWLSSYTKQPIPRREMEEWLNNTVEEILALHPREVLEIGCGSGLLLLQLSRRCKRYAGIDVSRFSLESVRRQMEALGGCWNSVSLIEQPANEFTCGDNSFDTAIINSVAQYFPDAAYLTEVLDLATKAVRPGGAVFIGDIRSLPLQEAFALSVEMCVAEPDSTLADLRTHVRRRLDLERELVISPHYFPAFQRRTPKVSRVEITLKRGHFRNEMTCFRYDAILHLGREEQPDVELSWLDASDPYLTIVDIRRLLMENPPLLGVMRVSNARVEGTVEALERFSSADGAITLREFRDELLETELHKTKDHSIDPEELWSLGGELGYQVDIGWASSRADGSYDVLFRRLTDDAERDRRPAVWPPPQTSGDDLHLFTNVPCQLALRQSLALRLEEHCRGLFSSYTIPCRVLIVDALPFAADGMPDRQMLLSAL